MKKNMSSSSIKGKPLQNSSKAVQFFSDNLEFMTTPYGVNRVLKEKDSSILIIDVRSARNYAEGQIPGAINIPCDEHNDFEGDEKTFVGLEKDKLHYVYCYTLLCNLADKASKKFASLGYPVKAMRGDGTAGFRRATPLRNRLSP